MKKTKFTTLEPKQKQEPKNKTVFEKYFDGDTLDSAGRQPSDFDNVKHLFKDSSSEKDVFMAWDNESPENVCLYSGIKGDEFD